MTKEELLKPRWKVIADYPGNDFEIGTVISEYTFAQEPRCYFIKVFVGDCHEGVDPEEYPAIFKKLEWWEERKEEDMPKFLRFKKNNEVFKFFITLHNIQTIYHERYPNQLFHLSDFEPATEEEYLTQERNEQTKI